MKEHMACNPRLAAFALLAAAQLSDALSLPSWPSHSRVERLQRRQSDDSSMPAPINIAPSQYWEGNDGPWSTFPLQVGTGSEGGLQNVRVMISTAATAIWTIGALGCPNNYISDCPNLRGGLFLTNQSLTWSPDSIYETGLEMNLGRDSSGEVGYDVATLGWQGSGSEVTDQHQIIWNIADSTYWTGIFGMNPRPTNLSDFSNPQTSFMQNLFNNGKIPSVSYGYTAGNQYRLDKVFGSLTLGGYDENRFQKNDISFPFYEDVSRDLSVNLQSITTSKGSPSNLLPDGSISIFIDSTVPEIWLPESACTAFEQAFGIEYNDNYQRYVITSSLRQRLLAQNAEVTFTIGPSVNGGKTVDITLPYSAFDLQLSFPIIPQNASSSYYFPLQKAANSTQYTLGRTFLQEAYVFADYDNQNFTVSQCIWNQEKVNSQNVIPVLSPHLLQKTHSSSDGGSGISTGAIVGIVIGVVALFALLGLALFFYRRRSRNVQKTREEEEKAASDIQEKRHASEPSSSNSTGERPPISNPIGGELDDSAAMHEMSSAHGKMPPQEMDSPHRADPKYHGYSEMPSEHGTGLATEMPASYPVFEMQGDTPARYNESGKEKGNFF